jgi:hypothetical protein
VGVLRTGVGRHRSSILVEDGTAVGVFAWHCSYCRALEDVGVFWAEDPINKMNDVRALADLRRQTHTPICGSETLGGLAPYRDISPPMR